MLAAKHSEPAKAKTEKPPEKAKSGGEQTTESLINPVWHQLATITLGRFGSEATPIRTRTATKPIVQRLCTNCEDELGAETSPIQTKLTVGAPDDEYEREADAVSERVMRMPVTVSKEQETSVLQTKPVSIQRVCSACKQSSGSASSSAAIDDQRIFAKRTPNGASMKQKTSGDISSRIGAQRGKGSPMSVASRAFFEPRFGADFNKVRIHTDREAATAARSLNAHAFTVGNDIFFGQNEHRPGSQVGRRLLAHELTHTIQQTGLRRKVLTHNQVQDKPLSFDAKEQSKPSNVPRKNKRLATQARQNGLVQRELFNVVDGASTVRAISTGGAEQIQRLALPSWEDIEQAGASAVETIGETAEAVGEAAGGAVEAVGEAAGEVVEAATGAVDWLATTAGQAALDSANALAGLFGGSVIIRRGCLIITIPNLPLFPSFQKTLGETPPMGFFIPFASGGALIGPFPVAGMVGALGYAQLSAEAAVGPGVLRNIRVEVCPFSGRYMGTAQLYAAAAIAPRLTLFGGLFAAGGVLIPMEPPIPIIAILEGGLRGIGTGWLIGAVQNTVSVLYSGGGLSFSNVTDFMGGVLLQGDLQLFAALRLYDRIICQYAHPLGHWQTGSAMRLTIPISASMSGTTGTGGVGPITWGPMPINDIETAIRPLPTGWNCLGWAKIKQILCDNGVLPPELCEEEEDEEEEPGVAGSTYACAICKCSGDKACGGGRIHTIWMGRTDCNKKNKKEAQKLCNHDSTFLSICDLDQNRPDGKKCSVHHHDFACSDRETKDKCINRRQSLDEAVKCPTQTVTMGGARCGATYGAVGRYCYSDAKNWWFKEKVKDARDSKKCQTGNINQTTDPIQSSTGCVSDKIFDKNGPPKNVAPCTDTTNQTVFTGPSKADVERCKYFNKQVIEVTVTPGSSPPSGKVITSSAGVSTDCDWS